MAVIAYSDVITTERLPIDAQDTITKVRLVIAGGIAGRDPTNLGVVNIASSEATTYFPNPITYEYEHADHATIGAERSFALPEGIDPFLPPTDASIPEPTGANWTNAGSPSAVRDGDPATYATLTSLGTGGSLTYAYDASFLGFRIKYKAEATQGFLTVLGAAGRANGYQVSSRHWLESEDVAEAYFVLPHDARNEAVNTSGLSGSAIQQWAVVAGSAHTTLEVYEFYPLVLNEALLEDIAVAQLRLPAQTPKRVTVRGYVPPDREHTITGWPGGDLVATVAQHQYELGRTIIDLEQAGAPVGLPAESIEAARERTASVRREIGVAGYSLKMGERQ